jgi:hypothetical protein
MTASQGWQKHGIVSATYGATNTLAQVQQRGMLIAPFCNRKNEKYPILSFKSLLRH